MVESLGLGRTVAFILQNFLEYLEDVPVIIEIIDYEERIYKLIPFLNEAVKDGLITHEKVSV
jgi:hypothetical protein